MPSEITVAKCLETAVPKHLYVLYFGANFSLRIEFYCNESPNMVVSSHATFAERLLWQESTPLVLVGANEFRPPPPLLYHHHRKAHFWKAVL